MARHKRAGFFNEQFDPNNFILTKAPKSFSFKYLESRYGSFVTGMDASLFTAFFGFKYFSFR
jgi:hypothetical protein